MRCRAWETKHQNGKAYIHVVDESLTVEVVKDIAERIAGPLLKEATLPVLRDIAGSYLVADKGNESIGFGQFVPLDSHVLDDFNFVRSELPILIEHQKAIVVALGLILEKLGVRDEGSK